MTQKKLYVGSIPYKVTENELRSLFSTMGEVASLRIVTDKLNGQSKGFAFVEMSTSEGAQKAIAELNGKELGGRKLVVSEAREPTQRRTGGGGGSHSFRGHGGGHQPSSRGGYRDSNREGRGEGRGERRSHQPQRSFEHSYEEEEDQ